MNKNKSDTFTFSIPVDQILSIMKYIQFTVKNLPYTATPNLSKLCGKIISNKFVLGNITQLKARKVHKIIQAELTWDKRIRLHVFCILTKSLLFLFLRTQFITPYPHNFLTKGENIYALNFSVNTKENKVRPGGSYSLFSLPYNPSPQR